MPKDSMPAALLMGLLHYAVRAVLLITLLSAVGYALIGGMVLAGFWKPEVRLTLPLSVAPPAGELGDNAPSVLAYESIAIGLESPTSIVVAFLLEIILLLGSAAIAWQLVRFLNTVRAGHPFAAENPPRIRAVGLIIMALIVFDECWSFLTAQHYLAVLTTEGQQVAMAWSMDWETLLLGGLIAVIAQILQIGVTLKEEQDLTV